MFRGPWPPFPAPAGILPEAGSQPAGEDIPRPEASIPRPEAGIPQPEAGIPLPGEGIPRPEAGNQSVEADTPSAGDNPESQSTLAADHSMGHPGHLPVDKTTCKQITRIAKRMKENYCGASNLTLESAFADNKGYKI